MSSFFSPVKNTCLAIVAVIYSESHTWKYLAPFPEENVCMVQQMGT